MSQEWKPFCPPDAPHSQLLGDRGAGTASPARSVRPGRCREQTASLRLHSLKSLHQGRTNRFSHAAPHGQDGEFGIEGRGEWGITIHWAHVALKQMNNF